MQEEVTGADDYDGSVIDLDALDAAEVDAEAEEPQKDQEAEEVVEAESPPAVEDDDEEKTSTSKSLQGRFDKLTKQIRETERESIEERERRIALEKEVDALRAQIPVEPKKTLADFQYDENAYREYVIEDARAEAREVARQEAMKVNREYADNRKATEVQTEYQKREESFAKETKDFNEKCYDPNLKISAGMAEVIKEVDVGPELFYYLGSHPEDAASIASLSPVTAGMEMAAIVTKIRDEKAKASEKEVSNAPPPPGKIAGVDASLKKVSTADPKSDKLSDEEWFKREELRTAKLRG